MSYPQLMPERDADVCDLLCLDLPTAEALRTAMPAVEVLEQTAAVAQALADPTRLRVALALRQVEELCVCDLAWIAQRPDELVSHHVRLLRSAGLVVSRRDGRMVMYSLTATGAALLDAVAAPLEAST